MSKSVIELCAESAHKTAWNSQWEECGQLHKEEYYEYVKAIIATLAANLDVRALDEAIVAHLKSQWRAMNEATGENPMVVAIQTYFNAIKEGEHE